MASIEETLRSLRDVQGVYGSFVIAGTGGLVAKDLPPLYDGQVFADLGPRITRFYETFLSLGEELDACILRYEDHKLYLRRMTWGLIGVVSGLSVNMPALRMVANLVLRRIDPEVAPSLRPTAPPLSAPPLALRTLEPVAIPLVHAHTPPPAPYPLPPTFGRGAADNETVRRGAADNQSVSRGADIETVRARPMLPQPGAASVPPLEDLSEDTVVAQDGRDSAPPTSDRHVRMYRGRRVVDE
jgi:hypothetical protein